MRLRYAIYLGLIGAWLTACGGPAAGPSPTLPPEARVSVAPDDPSIPYGITAIDYHFHDAHPSRVLTSDRSVRFTNQGTVKHNVTFPEFGFSHDHRILPFVDVYYHLEDGYLERRPLAHH